MEEIVKSLDDLLNELDNVIQSYFHAHWAEQGVDNPGDAVESWALVANFGNLNEIGMHGYTVEAYPPNMPPHSMKGLFREGIAWVEDRQEEAE
jgi:hypothetical protein